MDFSPAPAQARNEEAGRKTKSSRTGGIGPTAVGKPPLPTAGGGGGGDVNRREGLYRQRFLTRWAHDVEIEFMIDTGSQVTILSATVFQHMCVVKPGVRSALQVCRRRLVSADSSSPDGPVGIGYRVPGTVL